MNVSLLREIVCHEEKNRDFTHNVARVLGISTASVSARHRGRTDYTVSQINKLKEAYNLDDDEIIAIFFN